MSKLFSVGKRVVAVALVALAVVGAPVVASAVSYIPLPDVGDVLASTTEQSSDLVTWAVPLLALVLGLFVAGLVLYAIKKGIVVGLKRIAGGGRRRGGRRGRR